MSQVAVKVIREYLSSLDEATKDEAKKRAMSRIPAGFEVVSESVEGGTKEWMRFRADTLEKARAKAKHPRDGIPGGVKVLKREETPQSKKDLKVVVEAIDEAESISKAQTKAEAEGHHFLEIGKVAVKTPPRMGFLGFGKRSGQYEVEISEVIPAQVYLEYTQSAFFVIKAADPKEARELIGERIPKMMEHVQGEHDVVASGQIVGFEVAHLI